MWKRLIFCLSSVMLCLLCPCCQKEDISPLKGTAWECVEEPEIIVFTDNHSGIWYLKSAIDGVFDEIYSSFDFTYEVSGKNITLLAFFSRRTTYYDFVLEDDETLVCGIFHYKKIHHKVNINNSTSTGSDG